MSSEFIINILQFEKQVPKKAHLLMLLILPTFENLILGFKKYILHDNYTLFPPHYELSNERGQRGLGMIHRDTQMDRMKITLAN